MQRRYDYAYLQCMYGNGNRIPVAGRMQTQQPYQTQPQQRYLPPPPPGSPPPPDAGSY